MKRAMTSEAGKVEGQKRMHSAGTAFIKRAGGHAACSSVQLKLPQGDFCISISYQGSLLAHFQDFKMSKNDLFGGENIKFEKKDQK